MSAPAADDDRLRPTAEEIDSGSSSEDSDDEKEGKNVGESVEELLNRILDGLHTSTRDFAAFGADRERLAAAGSIGGHQQNALHLLASRDKKQLLAPDAKLEPMVRFLVSHRNDLLKELDWVGRTPLSYAIVNKKESMVRWMCGTHKNINAVLRIPDDKKRNWYVAGARPK
jgi:hypothetical protein